jgi:ceramide glucosyltransferase
MSKFPLIAALSLATLSAAYSLLCVIAALLYARRRTRHSGNAARLPPVSILKPLKGTDAEVFESLRSHCLQDYPEYEILFGISDPDDPTAKIVKRLQDDFPDCVIQLVPCERQLGSNGKVSTLAQLAAIAKYDFLVVNDSDIRVDSAYLGAIISELQKPGVGLVTCLYRGVPARTLGSRLESIGISTDFVPGVLVASLIEGGIRFGLGSTLAFRKQELRAIGGFEALADYLADDYELGRRISQASGRVELSSTVVETFLPAYEFSGFVTHQLRWMRTIRASRPSGYAGLPLTFTLFWAILTLILSAGSPYSWALVALAVSLRTVVAITTGSGVLRDQNVLRLLWLLPLRDMLAPFIWVAGLFGNKIVWRGKVFTLNRGKLVPRA